MQGQLTMAQSAQRGGLADWLTVERAAYAGIVVLALGLRLYGLGRVTLGPAEAAQALPAWAAVAGQPYDLSRRQSAAVWLAAAAVHALRRR